MSLTLEELKDAFKSIDLNKVGEQCKGLVFRCEITTWVGKDNDVNFRERYRFIKSMSCEGCDQCGYLWDDIREDIPIIHNGEHGKLYTLEVVNMSRDWESGCVDDWDLEFVEMKNGN